jgi:transposase
MLVATIASTNSKNITTYSTQTFSTLNPDLLRFRQWLSDNQCSHVCMESTGKYWIPIFNIFEKDIHVILTHPKYVRAIKGKKTDKKDSKWIADLFKFDMVKSSFIPPRDIRALREIARYRFKLVCMSSSERNRYQNSMTISNIGLASILSDPFGKTASGIMQYVLTSKVFDDEHCKKLIHKTAKKKTELILQSIHQCCIESDQRFKMNQVKAHLDFLDEAILKTEAELFVRIQPYAHLISFLSSNLPGISSLSAALILAETGADMSVFESSKHLVSWAGLAPASNESAGKKKSVRISKAGQYLKPLLVQCALAAARAKSEPYFAVKYQRIKKRRGHKKAIIAIARMMLTCIYHMISTGESFNPSDCKEFAPLPAKKQIMNVDNALAFLASEGFDISTLSKVV